MEIELELLEFELTIAKLAEIRDLDSLFNKARFVSLTKTADELSLVIDSDNMPKVQFANEGWKAFKIIGPLDFSLVGIVQKVIEPLAANNISIFNLSTFDTDYIMVRKEQVNKAVEVLKKSFKMKSA